MSRWTDGLPDTLRVGVGQAVVLPLTGAVGAGNSWTATDDDAGVATTEVLLAPPATPPAASSEASEVLVVTGVRPGRTVAHLRLGRSWETTDLSRHDLAIDVG
jgi:hypothetical protein